MERSNRIIFVSHCILNQNAVVSPLARSKGAYTDIIRVLMDNGIGIHQIPCPECKFSGLSRKPMNKQDYNTVEYRELNKTLALDTLSMIKEYLNNNYEIVGIIGINESPTCSVNGEMGIFIEELTDLFNKNKIKLYMTDVPVDYYDGSRGISFIEHLNKLIKEA